MRNAGDKTRDMARSLLPSAGRKGARKARAHVSRRTRHRASAALDAVRRSLLNADAAPGLDVDSSRDMRSVVTRRRYKDKVAPFQRWARAVTADAPRESRLSQVRGLLPRGLIGEHALSHLKSDRHFESEHARMRQAAWRAERRAHRRGNVTDRGHQAELLRQLLALPDGQRTFNAHLKRCTATHARWARGRDGRRHLVFLGPRPPRLLLGVHDVLAFLDDLARRDTPTQVWEAVHAFLRAFHRCHGDLEATLHKVPVPRLPPPAGDLQAR
jgi:hypothetical protein